MIIAMLSAAVAASVASVWARMEFPRTGASSVLLGSVTYSSIMCAFVGVSASILIAVQTPALQAIRSHPKYQEQIRRMLAGAFLSGFLLANYSVILLALGCPSGSIPFAIWAGLVAGSIPSVVMLLWMMLAIFSDPEAAGSQSGHEGFQEIARHLRQIEEIEMRILAIASRDKR